MKLIRRLKIWWFLWNRSEKYKHPIYREYLYWLDLIKAWWKGIALKRAKRLADARHLSSGKTIYVLPDDKGRPRSFDNKEIAILKKHRLMHKKVTCVDLYREAMYIANAKTVKKK